MLVPITRAQINPLNMPAQLASGSRGLNFGLGLHQSQFSVYVISEGSGKTAFPACRCDMYQTLMNKLYKHNKELCCHSFKTHLCPIEIIKGLTDMGQFQYLTKLKGPQVGNYLFTTQFLSLR